MKIRFDRGTLLIETSKGDDALANVPYVLWDPRVLAYRAPAFRYVQLIEEMRRERVRFSDVVRNPDALSGRWETVALRPYQSAAIEAWELSGRRGIISLPTGSGKTRVAIAALARLGRSALCVAPTIALMEQWLGILEQNYKGPIGVLGDGKRRLEALTVATYESAYRQMASIGDRFAALVIDEAHHFGVGIRDESLEMSTAAIRIGLTGTRPQDPNQIERISRLIGPVVYELAMTDLGGYIAPLERTTWTVALTPEERLEYRMNAQLYQSFSTEYRRSNPGGRWQDFVKTAAKSEIGRRALKAWHAIGRLLAYTAEKKKRLGELLARHRGSRVLIFCADNASAYAIAREHLVMPITCEIDRKEREQAFASFAAGELRGLVSSRVLNEGVDLPDADLAIVVSAALGEREHLQRVGRVLRPGEGKRALLYQLVAGGTLEVGRAERRNRGLHP
jgi:superfamily II DNA or RNA helicase